MLPPIPLRLLRADVDLDVSGPGAEEMHRSLAALWAGCGRDATAPGRRVTVRVGAPAEPESIADPDAERLPTTLTHALVRIAIESGAGELLMLHAAGLADPVTGAAVACVARGGTGKTTLCRTLGPGRRYLTDETLALRRDGTVVPFAKPLSVRRADEVTKDEVAPGSLALGTEGAAPWLAALVLLRREPTHVGQPSVERLGLFDTIVALAEETSSLDRLDRPLHLLADLLDVRPVLAVTYAEATTLGPLLDELIGPAR
ncbi:hypothetical protein GCM10011519_26940 [Marmoricola endophyticus]|uniref:Uncharacterized protein n=1 Tax=Marmoricola endophyticus TaxID=2040280 RepID=A0A917BM56_9ACTN|nr:hypothetical protein [Marmoricola endophyticus]GGF51552.1 hypothetical protein GCM10011519_26940 [Marmoricola endophyticus]